MRRIALAIVVLVLTVSNMNAMEIKKQNLVGAWVYVESYLQLPDGRRITQYSEQPKGIFVLLPNGRYSHIIMRDDLPKVASGTNLEYTPEEAMAIAKGNLSHFGTYTVDEKAGQFTAHIQNSSFPNFDGVKQTRRVTKLTKDVLQYINEVTNVPGGIVFAHLRRVW